MDRWTTLARSTMDQLQPRGGGGRGKHMGPNSWLIGAQKAAEQRCEYGEGGGGGALDVGSLGVQREGKEGQGRSGGRSGCRGTLL
jgi:hypothetical protein